MNMPTLLMVSLWRGMKLLLDEVRRTSTGLVVIMLLVVVIGTIIAELAH